MAPAARPGPDSGARTRGGWGTCRPPIRRGTPAPPASAADRPAARAARQLVRWAPNSFAFSKSLAQSGQRPEPEFLHAVLRPRHPLRDLGKGQAFKVPQDDDLPVILRQP